MSSKSSAGFAEKFILGLPLVARRSRNQILTSSSIAEGEWQKERSVTRARKSGERFASWDFRA
jgi:hypothetical protein